MRVSNSLVSGVVLGTLVSATAIYAANRIDLSNVIGTVHASETAGPVQLPTVDVARAEARLITEWDEFAGRFEAVDEVVVRARVSGHLDAVHFTPGEVVQQGDLLFTVDARPFEAALAQAEARLAEARATARVAERTLQRGESLRAQGHISQANLDERSEAAETAAAAVAAAEAAVERARLDLGFTTIHAPITGRISDDFVSPGNLIDSGPGSAALTTIVSLDPIHFAFDATERQYLEYIRASEASGLREMTGETPVSVSLIDNPDAAHDGVIDFIDNRIDQATGTIRGRAVLSNGDNVLTPGMFGRLRLAKAVDVERVVVPERAIASDQTTKFVVVVGADGISERRNVVLRDRHDGMRVVEGVRDGEQVIVGGLHMAMPGTQVTARLIDQPAVQLAQR